MADGNPSGFGVDFKLIGDAPDFVGDSGKGLIVLAGAVGLLSLGGCTTFMAMQDASDPALVGQVDAIPFYTPENNAAAPPVKTIVGPAAGNSCKLNVYSPNASETAALKQLRLKAVTMGANGLVGVRSEHGARLWERIAGRVSRPLEPP